MKNYFVRFYRHLKNRQLQRATYKLARKSISSLDNDSWASSYIMSENIQKKWSNHLYQHIKQKEIAWEIIRLNILHSFNQQSINEILSKFTNSFK